jgi:8-amino-7-oxononanoate synthase
VLDFTSSLYLGFDHASQSLPGWTRLTLGKPAALEELEGTPEIEKDLAALTGCEAAALGTSTLHLFWDLFGMLAKPGSNIFLDQGSYPIARWGVERAVVAGAAVGSFSRSDVDALRSAMRRSPPGRPIVVTDGFRPALGSAAPLADYAECVGSRGGLVVVDDTQALGIFGQSIEAFPPYGRGGGGSLWRLTRRREEIVVVSSLAKAFGAPVAMLGGAAGLLAGFRRSSQTRVHCSPPSAASLSATRQALEENRRCGDSLRRRLSALVARFRKGLRALGLLTVPGCFPVQPLRLPEDARAERVYEDLLGRGVRSVLYRPTGEGAARIGFIFTARHRRSEIDCALEALAAAVPRDAIRSVGVSWSGFTNRSECYG